MNFEECTKQLQNSMDIAKSKAKELGCMYIESEHLLYGLAQAENSVSKAVLKKYNITAIDIDMQIEEPIRKEEKKKRKFDYTPRAKDLLSDAREEASRCKAEKIGTEHLLMAIIRDSTCKAHQILAGFGHDVRKIFFDILYAMGEDPSRYKEMLRKTDGSETPTIDKFGRDLTLLASEGKLSKVIARDEEIERIIEILSRKTKNNPCLVGEAGVGKTAIVEGLAYKIFQEDVPERLSGQRLISLELSGVVAGTKYRGEFEERIQNIVKEASNSNNIILFIDEIHTIIGAGGAEGSLDASNILKPALARGEIQLIGATTLEEYRKHIEKDPALERRFQPVEVNEPSEQNAIAILEGICGEYEKHHKVTITEDAIIAAVKLSERYINDRFLPDKAIDLMDEAAAKANLKSSQMPDTILKLEEVIMELSKQLEEALQSGEIEQAKDVKKKLETKSKKLEKEKVKWKQKRSENKIIVGEEDIAALVSKWTKIPVEKITQKETERLLNLEDTLHKRVVGQQEAVTAIAKAIRRGRVGIKDPNRPIGSFLFLGPTGVGKTELSKALAEAVFGSEDAMIRVDMSEYMEKHSVSKLIGSPPGYVGYEEGGQLSEKIRRKPYSVVLFDEIEKAHPDVFHMLLQVLDDGYMTDAHGKKINFKNTILIMTSNIGANKIVDPKQLGFSTNQTDEKEYATMKQNVFEELKQVFRPEFINRIDEIIVFHSLTPENVEHIVEIMLKKVSDRIAQQFDIKIKITEKAKKYLAKKSYDKKYGARPLRRTIQNEIEDEMATLILEGNVKERDTICIDSDENKVIMRKI